MKCLKFLFIFALLLSFQSAFALDDKAFESLVLINKTQLNYFGFKLYDIELRGENKKFSYDQKLAIKINYDKNFSKKELTETSIDEISRINNIDREIVAKAYKPNFEKLFVDVKKGDEKIAIYDPKTGLKLFYNGKFVGAVDDTIFAKRFIDIWLSDKARFKKARDELVGLI